MTRHSVIAPKLEFNQDFWVVSVLIQDDKGLGSSLTGHVQISVEGLENDGREFRGRYELFAAPINGDLDHRFSIAAQDTRTSPAEVKIERFALEFSYRRPVAVVEKMLEKIKAEASLHRRLRAAGQSQSLPRYNRDGGYAGEKDAQGNITAHSCASWVNETMSIISARMTPKRKEIIGLSGFHQALRHPKVRAGIIGAVGAMVVVGFFVNRSSNNNSGSTIEFKPN